MTKEYIISAGLRNRPIFSADNILDLSAMRALVPDMGIENFLSNNRKLTHRKAEGLDPTEDELQQHKLLMEQLFRKLWNVDGSSGRKYHAREWRAHLRSVASFWQFDTKFNELRGEE